MKINLETDVKAFVQVLGRTSNKLQIAAADTLNETAKEVRERYNESLTTGGNIARNKFTINASKVLESNPIRRNGTPRKLNQINSKVVIRKMSGGKEHYLAKAETPGTQRGNPLTMGKVPVPLTTARIGKSDSRAISAGNRLIKGKTQTLRTGGRKIGVRGDGYNKTGQRWSVLYGSIRRGTINGDPKKPFYMIDNKNNLGIFKLFGKRVRKIRSLKKNSIRIKGNPRFEKSVKAVSPIEIQKKFVSKAEKMTT